MNNAISYPETMPVHLPANRMLAVLTGCLIAAVIAAVYLDWRTKTHTVVFPTPYQAVLLTNGTVYYGQLSGYGTTTPVLSHAFYIVARNDGKAVQNVLVRRGKELHGPDRMYVNPASIAFVETVGKGSKVSELIAEAEKE